METESGHRLTIRPNEAPTVRRRLVNLGTSQASHRRFRCSHTGAVPAISAASFDVLVVDFDDGIRRSSAEILASCGYRVAEAESAEQAAEILHMEGARLLLLEPDLPLVSGVEFIEQLLDPPPTIIFSTAPVSDADQLRFGNTVNIYLTKPVPPLLLIAGIQAVLGRRA